MENKKEKDREDWKVNILIWMMWIVIGISVLIRFIK